MFFKLFLIFIVLLFNLDKIIIIASYKKFLILLLSIVIIPITVISWKKWSYKKYNEKLCERYFKRLDKQIEYNKKLLNKMKNMTENIAIDNEQYKIIYNRMNDLLNKDVLSEKNINEIETLSKKLKRLENRIRKDKTELLYM